nr:cysteine-rich receptor-like protein kinase 29 [Quercus suber]
MELEGHMHKDKGLHEGKADFAEVGSQMKQVDGCQAIQSDLVVHDQNEIGTLSMDLDQSNFGLGPNTRTWKRQQVQAKVGDTVSSNDVEVGTKRKHKVNLNMSECSEIPELKKRKGDDEVLVCTPDLSELDCNTCLKDVQDESASCCNGKQGGIFSTPSCVLRYETYRFSDPSAETPPPPPPSPPPELPTSTPGKESNSSRTTIVVVVTTISAAVLIISICICFYLRKRNPRKKVESEAEDEISVVESLQFDFGTIRVATQNFSDANKLGEGGFGIVYKGKFSNGQEIAVKRLSRNSSQGEVEFKNEVMLVAKLQHRNLVRLLGFCLEGDERLLVYEFVPNGSLDRFIFDPIKRAQLNWEKRFQTIGGIARGLLYLHEDSQLRIIHRDLKASNILLDASMNPKISDFGMARLFQLDQTQGKTSRIVGTYGYMPPEYAFHGQFSVKSDVFSFGVILLEMVAGQKSNTFHIEDSGDGLINYAWKQWRDGTTSNFVDPTLRTDSTTEIMKCIHIGLLCVQENVDKRPTMASIVLMLNSESMSLSVPSQPAFLMHSSTRSNMLLVEHDSREMGSIQFKSNSVKASVNEVSISELDPR